MIKQYKKWVYLFVLFVFTLLFTNVYFLYLADTFSVITKHPKTLYHTPNQRHLIIDYLLEHLNQYDTLIMGSSRVWFINPLRLKEATAYNMTYAEGIPHEHLLNLKFLLKKGMKIRHVILALDDFSYRVDFNQHQRQLASKLHYKVTGIPKFEYYKLYLLRLPKKRNIEQLRKKYFNKPLSAQESIVLSKIFDTIYKQSFEYSKRLGNDVNLSDTRHNNASIFTQPSYSEGNVLKATLQDLQEIIQLSHTYKFKLTLFINPIHHATYKATDKVLFDTFKRELSYLTSYYDFSLPNKINNNNAYWNDTSHYKYYVGDLILQRLFESKISIKDFGVFVKKEENL